MPSYARKHQLEGNLVYHVLNRANRRERIFHDNEDYLSFKNIVLKYSRIKGISVYHYCIMPNHYHLLLEIKEPELLSSAMSGINKSYTMYHHKRYNSSGYLWQGRFKSKPIQKDEYLLSCGRYIERNPFICNMVRMPQEYPFSSARYYILHIRDPLIAENPLYNELGKTQSERAQAYKNFILSFDEKQPGEYNNFTAPLGNTEFIKKLHCSQGRYLPRRQGRIG